MNNAVESHFSELPHVEVPRSIFDTSFTHKTSFNTGELIPFALMEVLPGDTFKVTTSKVVRLQTLLTPVMDNLYLDCYWFYVKNIDIWQHWKEFCGENTAGAWAPQVEYQVPSISAPSGGFDSGTLADYFGLPVGVDWDNTADLRPSALPFRAYARVANDYFRDENLSDPLNIPISDSNQVGSNGSNYITDVVNGGKPFRVAKYHDYFTSALPTPQKGPTVTFPLISGSKAPVIVDASHDVTKNYGGVSGVHPVYFTSENNLSGTHDLLLTGSGSTSSTLGYASSTDSASSYQAVPNNLWADLTTSVGAVSINELRLAFQLQRYYEKSARSGSRYNEFVKAFFGTTPEDATIYRPEYLGGNRVAINIHEVTNTAQTSQDFLGDLGASSVTNDIHEDFVHSFSQHGYIIGVCCARYDHTYTQGMARLWMRRKFTDFYIPTFANLGEMPVYKAEIYADANTIADSSDVFGYQEAWSSYRYGRDYCSSEMRPGVANTLASWHFGDYYTQAPTLSDGWIREDKANVDRTLAVTSANANQIFADFYVKAITTRVMPVYSIPGLIDHN